MRKWTKKEKNTKMVQITNKNSFLYLKKGKKYRKNMHRM